LLDAHISKSTTLLDLHKKYQAALLDKGAAEAENLRIKGVEAAWKTSWDSTNKLAESVFMDWANGGENSAKKIGDALKKALLEAIYASTLKPIIFKVFASVMGSGGATGDKTGAGINSVQDGLNGIVSKGTDWLKDTLGITTLATSISGAIEAGWVMAEAGGAMTTIAEGWALATSGGISAGIAGAGSMIGAAASGIYTALAAIPGWGWAAMALLTQFDQSKLTLTGTGIEGNLSSAGATGVKTTENYDQDHHGIFGIGAYTTKNVERKDASSGLTDMLTKAVKTVTAANAQYAKMLGLDAKALDGYSAALAVNTTGLDAAGIQTAIMTEMTKFSAGQLAFAYGDVAAAMGKAGETVEQTLQRLVGTQQARMVLNELGGIFGKIAGSGIAATESMIAMSGSLDKLLEKATSFVKNFYSSDEQTGMTARSILNSTAAVGINLTGVDTKAEFRTLIEGIDASTELGRAQITTLLNVAGAFSELVTNMGDKKKDLFGLAELAPELKALNPLFTTAATATSEAAVTTTAAINSTTAAVTAGSSNVVNAVGGLGETVALHGKNTTAAIERLNDRLDAIESNNRLLASQP
jgi:hypothetical protein